MTFNVIRFHEKAKLNILVPFQYYPVTLKYACISFSQIMSDSAKWPRASMLSFAPLRSFTARTRECCVLCTAVLGSILGVDAPSLLSL